MQIATATRTAPSCKPARRGFRVPCLACGETRILVPLDSILDDCPAEPLRCQDCDQEFTIARVRHTLAAWAACLAWLDTAPELADE